MYSGRNGQSFTRICYSELWNDREDSLPKQWNLINNRLDQLHREGAGIMCDLKKGSQWKIFQQSQCFIERRWNKFIARTNKFFHRVWLWEKGWYWDLHRTEDRQREEINKLALKEVFFRIFKLLWKFRINICLKKKCKIKEWSQLWKHEDEACCRNKMSECCNWNIEVAHACQKSKANLVWTMD